MCGRYKQTSSLQTLREMFGATIDGAESADGIVTPGMIAPVVHMQDGKIKLSQMVWGFVPQWAKEKPAAPLINARAETLADKPTFKHAYQHGRCLIPANAFYEWDIASKPKRAYEIGLADDVPFAFAGLWERWEDPVHGSPCETFAIITAPAQQPLAKIHDRQPVVLCGQQHFMQWLEGRGLPESISEFDMQAFDFPVKKRAAVIADQRQLTLF